MINERLPERLSQVSQENYDYVFANTSKLFLLSCSQFITDLSSSLGHPAWINNGGLYLHQTLTNLTVIIKDEKRSMPISSEFRFYRRPQDDKIAAIAIPSSTLVHYDIWESEVKKLFPHIDKRSSDFHWDSSSQHYFKYWASEKVDNRITRIKSILND